MFRASQLNSELSDRRSLATQFTVGTLILCLQIAGITDTWSHSLGIWDLSSSPHSYKASTLPAESCPQPSYLRKHIYT